MLIGHLFGHLASPSQMVSDRQLATDVCFSCHLFRFGRRGFAPVSLAEYPDSQNRALCVASWRYVRCTCGRCCQLQLRWDAIFYVTAPVYLVSKGSSRAVSRMMAENEHVQPLLNGGSARMWGNHLISHLRGPTNLSMSFWRSSDAVLGFHWELQGICHSGQGFRSVA